ncbi:hypothetical protein E2C01_055684 [Portunus trituberculatus]|uniref:Uncharacterized protein n=1 Tax=Portunus trituberculatus TaxID=210409 RepID=A0A5B7GN54_PORTR|nr:hypothetical protein [Portunus trituberculatus]
MNSPTATCLSGFMNCEFVSCSLSSFRYFSGLVFASCLLTSAAEPMHTTSLSRYFCHWIAILASETSQMNIESKKEVSEKTSCADIILFPSQYLPYVTS